MDEDIRTFRITGDVQGVGFRWWTRKTASSLALRGTVTNESDGSVTVRAAGEPSALDTLEEKLRSGPPTASVEAVDRLDGTGTSEPGEESLPAGFEIVR